jgi:large subunit ribosomal protein L24
MKQKFSKSWIRSKQPRKQRKYRYNAPMHVRQKFVSAHLSEVLRNRFGKRSLALRKGDEVKVVRGESKGFKGRIERIDLKNSKVYIEGLNVKKVDGSEVLKPIHPSNLIITDPKMEDKRRQIIIERASGSKRKLEEKKGATKERGKVKTRREKKD